MPMCFIAPEVPAGQELLVAAVQVVPQEPVVPVLQAEQAAEQG